VQEHPSKYNKNGPEKDIITYQWLCIFKFCMRDYSINTPVSDIWDWRSQGQQHLYFFLALTQRSKLYWQPSQLQQEGKYIIP
jgi:hypothetical protein